MTKCKYIETLKEDHGDIFSGEYCCKISTDGSAWKGSACGVIAYINCDEYKKYALKRRKRKEKLEEIEKL